MKIGINEWLETAADISRERVNRLEALAKAIDAAGDKGDLKSLSRADSIVKNFLTEVLDPSVQVRLNYYFANIVVVPFDEALVREGVNVALAIKLFDEETVSLGKAARLAGMGLVEFMDILAALRIPVARPLPGELEKELESFG